MYVNRIERTVEADCVKIQANLSGLLNGPPDFKLWFSFPKEMAGFLSTYADPFLSALLALGMTGREPLIIDGDISKRLLAGSEQIMPIWRKWHHHLRILSIKPGQVVHKNFRGRRIACFFTAGVDSFYTLLKNFEFEQGSERITHLIYIHGFDVPLENRALYRKVVNHLSEIAQALKLKLILAATNLRELTDRYVEWDTIQHGAALASIGLCLSPVFKRVYIPSGDTYATLSPWGSHPLVDPLWSTESMEFRHDGCEASRMQKIQGYIARSDIALDHLRVCWKNPENQYNCGECEKCLRTMISLRIAGSLKRCKTFGDSLDLESVRSICTSNRVTRYFLQDNLKVLERLGGDCELRSALNHALKRSPPPWAKVFQTVRKLDERLLGRRIQRLYHAARRVLMKVQKSLLK